MKAVDDAVAGIYGVIKEGDDSVATGGKAPAQVGKPIFAKDLEIVKSLGCKTPGDVFGHKDQTDDSFKSRPINFGSKSDTLFMPDDTRLRLFNLKKMINDCEVQACAMFKTAHPTPQQILETPLYKHRLQGVLKSFNVTDFSSWIPLINARFYFEEYELPYLLANEFDQQPMDSATVKVEGALGLLEGKEEADSNFFDLQSNTQSDFTVFSRNNVTHAEITEDLMQDSAPAIINKLRKEVMMGAVRAYERAIINGDTTDSGGGRGSGHMDADIAPVSKHFSKAFDGLRRRAMGNSANGVFVNFNGDSPNKNLWRNLLKSMDLFASEKDDLCFIYGPKLGLDLVSGAIPELFTAFAFGGLASNVTGQVPPVFGVKGIESRFVREDLDATGVYSGTGQTKTVMIVVKKSRFQNYVRAAARVWAAPSLPNTDQMLMTCKIRHAFAGNPQTAKELSVAVGYNIETAS